ncbi:hypothetical protein [Dongshaea marina]|uniref:hypothetical protein n=1 Tax=Dongshaea marina TaxID=2047966 RepID=UPI000D3E07B2|nr:hypothetical protein [Dongshaea marina]
MDYQWLSGLAEREDYQSRLVIFEDMCRCLRDAGVELTDYFVECDKLAEVLHIPDAVLKSSVKF